MLRLTSFILIILFFTKLSSLGQQYPFYFLWDMDHISSLDTILIHSGGLPDHINHPGFGFYLLETLWQKISSMGGPAPLLTLPELAKTLNPLGAMSFHVSLMRSHLPLIISLIVFLLTNASLMLFEVTGAAAFVGLALYWGLQESFWYQATMIRTEIVAILYFSLALNCYLGWARKLKYSNGMLVVIGFFLGLSFLTKIQGIFLLLIIPILIISHSYLHSHSGSDDFKKTNKTNVCNFIIFLGLSFLSFREEISTGFATFSRDFSPNSFFWGFFFLLTFLLLNPIKIFNPVVKPLGLLISGFFSSFITHFLLFQNAAASYVYLLYNFKMIFLRKSESLSLKLNGSELFKNFWDLFCYDPLPLVIHLTLILFLIVMYFLGNKKIANAKQKSWFILPILSLVLIGGHFLILRPILRDVLWWQVGLGMINMIYAAYIISSFSFKKVYVSLYGVGGLCFMLILISFYHHYSRLTQRIDANYALYGYQSEYWRSGVYAPWRYPYQSMMQDFFLVSQTNSTFTSNTYNKDMWRWALKAAVEREQRQRWAEFVFPNVHIGYGNVGVLAKNFPIAYGDWVWRIETLPLHWEGAALIDPKAYGINEQINYNKELMMTHSEALKKVLSHSQSKGENKIFLLPRPDLEIAWASLIAVKGHSQEQEVVKVKNYSEGVVKEKKYYLTPISRFSELSWETLKEDGFLLVKARDY